jgi:hypothetical protein
MALQQAPHQALRQLWTVGQQRSDPPTAALLQQARADAAKAVALALRIDHRQQGGFTGAAGIDLLASAQQAGGGSFHLAQAWPRH